MAPPMARCLALAAVLGLVLPMQTVGQAASIEKMERTIEQLSRQLMLQQLFVEERVRSDGASGLKQTRLSIQGTLPYHTNTATGSRIAAIHEHANNIRVVGMGEFIAVLNGVEFRTRHNDYKLVQPQTTDTPGGKIPYNAVKDIPFPEVPPAVTSKGSVEKQIAEMREWFKAWKNQDHSIRDYRRYFKPILCYLEGGWTVSDSNSLDESFDSDRHFIDAKSWHDLQDKVRFTSYTGRKDSAENFAYLPTTIMSTDNGTVTLAQWNYRIVCHPLQRDLSTKRLKLIDDITSRIAFGRTMEQHAGSRAARFRVAPEDKDTWTERIIKYDLLDELMSEIPGKDGYGNELLDDGLDGKVAQNYKTAGNLKAGYYHRWLKAQKDAMGSQAQHRAYADEYLFMAKTTQEKIAPMKVEKCVGRRRRKRCFSYSQQWTYAIPLELIYMTPLHRWNPYNIEYKGLNRLPPGLTVTNNGKLTGREKNKALNGTNNRMYYRTPVEFFLPLGKSNDKADTAGKALWVLDEKNVPQQVVASGARIFLPEIDEVGRLRTRYPIMPLHYEGSAQWKELTAIKDILLQPKRYSHMYYDNDSDTEEPTTVTLVLQTSKSGQIEQHEHFVYADLKDLEKLAENPGTTMEITTSEASGHTHTLTITANRSGRFIYTQCGTRRRCWDLHPLPLRMKEN